MKYLLNHKTLRDSWMDAGMFKLITLKEQEILKKLFCTETLQLCVTDLCLHTCLTYSSKQIGKQQARRMVRKLQKTAYILPVSFREIAQARALSSDDFDFEDALDVACIQSFGLEALITHAVHRKHFNFLDVNVKTIEELLDYLPKGLKLWSAYTLEQRRDFTQINFDLKEENLQQVTLSHADFSGLDLSGVNFMNAILEGVNFSNADLSEACLIGANLWDAILENANLQGVDFTDAKLIGADLCGANLEGANLTETDFTNAKITGINFAGVDITDDVNLTSVNFSAAISGTSTKVKDFTVRNIATINELRQLHLLECRLLEKSALPFDRLQDWWMNYKSGIKGLFYQHKILVGTISIWPITRVMAETLEERCRSEAFEEHELDTCPTKTLRQQGGTKYWYVGAVYLNESLRVKGCLGINFMAMLLYEAFYSWQTNDSKFIDTSEDWIEIYAISINENRTDVRDNVYQMLTKFGFKKMPGLTADGCPLYKLSQPFSEITQKIGKHFDWWAKRTREIASQ